MNNNNFYPNKNNYNNYQDYNTNNNYNFNNVKKGDNNNNNNNNIVYGKNKVILDETFDKYKEYLKNPQPFKPYFPCGYMGTIREDEFSQLIEPVTIISGLPEILNNEHRLFNLFCQYGNCLKIRKNKEGTYIYMADGFQSYVAQKYIDSIVAFNHTIKIYKTKYQNLSDGVDPNEFKLNYGVGFSKPTNQLYVKNLHNSIDEEYLFKLFQVYSPHSPIGINLQYQDSNNLTKHGLLNFKDIISATESLIIMNNFVLGENLSLILSFYTT